ncbi:hypothetical protein BI084_gp59 [Gordonia phage Terapin]|uniref:Uncharacterized protein n=6 Tax=Terapinvirus TaxID=2733216 RepID=A0A2Z4Q9F0_9CAUD|nr:hypothetical protein BI084_gp59 [Gordonia phage Terapin]YP_009803019.1 hypothetical protein HOT44_gp58 [Gordonia phage Suzy]AVP43335.1 hypothetical protein PBI_DJOKOVIC_58 [Gordonia phage Djokovic]AXH67769.1 hypothetical protein SEA_BEYONCAGE_58 [Gordonia phage Beyoncage]QOC56203.1 hypothetical protein SEA_SIENNA_58 [Gordonia phage Sienna]QOC56628.1 hypothetical protein SEA_BITESIZE_58 [Gordonia phage BiteSize]QYW00861.1 hypothetical protein SEA_MADI_58 [Gordonia phage Madi]
MSKNSALWPTHRKKAREKKRRKLRKMTREQMLRVQNL